MHRWLLLVLLVIPGLAARAAPEPKSAPREELLFDFEGPDDLKSWSNLEQADGRQQEPPARLELTPDHATRGKQSLKITFAGGTWPTITTTQVPADWMPYWTFQADVTALRHCVVGFTVLQEKSQRGGGWDATVSRWTKTEFLGPGKNEITGTLHDSNNYSINARGGKVTRLEIFMYRPRAGETIHIDNIRISSAREVPPPMRTEFKVQGTDWVVGGVSELGKKLKERWVKPEPKSLDQVEGEFQAQFEELKRTYPGAILAVFRDGTRGFDPAHPEKIYAGWRDAYWSSHGPDGMTVERATNTGKESGHEIFMRHRSPLMRVDLSSIPRGSKILAARLIIVRAYNKPVQEHHPNQPNMWVVEPCNRPWVEEEVNGYEYARDQFWKQIGGMYWGEDPDFLPLYLAYGPSQGQVNWWDFTEAVRFWTGGRQPNHGFMLHGNAGDWLVRAHGREAKELGDRPAVWVIYVP